jgi:RNA polymerase sigma-70 factor
MGDDETNKAFEILVRQHHRRVLAYATSILKDSVAAQDVAQEAFVVAYENLHRFDVSKDFGAWIRGIVRNKCKEWVRENKYVAMDEEVLEVLELQHSEWDRHEEATGERVFAALHACIGKLPGLLGEAVKLFYLDRRSGAEVARLMEADEAAIRKRLQRARGQLAKCITAAGGTN